MPEMSAAHAAAKERLLRSLLDRKCQAVDLPDGERCGQPSDGHYYRTICLREHITYLYLCTSHAERADGVCHRCRSHGHACSVQVTRLVMGMDGWETVVG